MIIQYLLYQIPSFTIHNSHYSNLSSISTIAITLILLVLMYIFIGSQPYHCSITLTNNYILSMNNYILPFIVCCRKSQVTFHFIFIRSIIMPDLFFFHQFSTPFANIRQYINKKMKTSLKFSNANKSI